MGRDSFCNQCGHRNPEGSNFCSSCGAAVLPAGEDLTVTFHTVDDEGEIQQPDVVVTIDTPSVGTLVVKSGAEAGTTFSLDAPVIVAGRSPDSDIFLDDVTVSRRHAEFRRAGDHYVVKDLNSLNGTYVNRVRITETSLLAGDEVQIGTFRLVFLSADGTRRGGVR